MLYASKIPTYIYEQEENLRDIVASLHTTHQHIAIANNFFVHLLACRASLSSPLFYAANLSLPDIRRVSKPYFFVRVFRANIVRVCATVLISENNDNNNNNNRVPRGRSESCE